MNSKGADKTVGICLLISAFFVFKINRQVTLVSFSYKANMFSQDVTHSSCFFPYTNNKHSDQSANPHSQISTLKFVDHCFKSLTGLHQIKG